MSCDYVLDHSKCEVAKLFWRRWASVAGICLLAVGWFAATSIVLYQKNRNIQNTKTAIVAAQAASMSGVATVNLGDRGQIIMSNAYADDMLAGGKNVEGQNIHDYCVDQRDREAAIEGMNRWYRQSPPGSAKAIKVTLKLPTGTMSTVVIAKTIKRTAGTDIAFTADLIPAKQFSYTDISSLDKVLENQDHILKQTDMLKDVLNNQTIGIESLQKLLEKMDRIEEIEEEKKEP